MFNAECSIPLSAIIDVESMWLIFAMEAVQQRDTQKSLPVMHAY